MPKLPEVSVELIMSMVIILIIFMMVIVLLMGTGGPSRLFQSVQELATLFASYIFSSFTTILR